MHSELKKSLSNYQTIILVGGWTGGHISPIVSIFEEFKNQEKNFYWIGGKNSNEEKEAKKNNINFLAIDILKLTTTKSPKIFLYPFSLVKSIFQARKILKSIKKNSKNLVIFSKWWPWSLAIWIAGKMLKIPVFIHESDTIPGRSNLQLSKFADKIFLGFEISKKFFDPKKTTLIGQILDPRIKIKWQWKLSWKTDKTHILVFCGSQWARKIFEEIAQNCQKIDAEWIIVLWKLNEDLAKNFEKFEHIQVFNWLEKEEQNNIFSNTNIAITRWSATTLSELQLFDITKIIIPLPSAAKNHQFYNAKEYEKQWDILLEQKNISELKNKIEQIIKNNP